MDLYTFDTETTGLPDWKAPSDAPHQPHLVDIAARLYNDEGQLLDAFEAIIKPAGWIIPDDVAAIHGITTERAMDEGIPEEEALGHFLAFHARAELRVAHNVSFDDRIIRIALKRYHSETLAESYKAGNSYCTCQNSRDIVQIPPTGRMLRAGFNKFKNPTLGEAYQHFFKEELLGAHRAMTDSKACARIYFALQGITLPAEASATAVLEA
ncbi:TPA: 3'-5' exonuclease [Pseudomonas aeruginosa]